MTDPILQLEGLVKRFETVTAVDGVDLEVRRGEVFGLLGPNGAGKTTTMRLLVGLLRPDDGTVTIAGHPLATEPLQAKAKLGYVPDRPFLYERLSGEEYMEFLGSLWSVPAGEAVARGTAVLERFRMADAATRLIEGYSHGMKQKLALAGVFLHRPELLVIDEPMVGLDPHAAREIRTMFREQADAGSTVLVSTHQLDVAETTCDRVGIIADGRLVALGTMEELRERADEPGTNLERLFLRLTEEVQAEIAEAVAAAGPASPA